MSLRLKKVIKSFYEMLGSRRFFWLVIAFFVLHTLWLAISAWRLPYDEYYHLGIIELYSKQWSPFIYFQSAESAVYGDITRLPSYMYHYLMSFPYRVLISFIQNEQLVIILLRLINIGMVVGSLAFFRRLFLSANINSKVINLSVLVFASLPMTVMLAAQINYDNLALFLSAILLLITHKIMTAGINFQRVLLFFTIGMFGSLVKYTFLTLFVFTAIVLLMQLALQFYSRKQNLIGLKSSFFKSKLSLLVSVVLVLSFLMASGLFIERHGVNVVKYGGINVKCDSVQSKETCSQYSPWRRNENAKKELVSGTKPPLFKNPLGFGVHWVATMYTGLLAIFANIPNTTNTAEVDPYGHYQFKQILTVLMWGGIISILGSSISIFLKRSALLKNPINVLILVISALMLLTLLAFNYSTYNKLGRPYAIQSRYMYSLMLPLIVLGLQALNMFIKQKNLKMFAVSTGILIVIFNGGSIGWIIRAENSWYFQNQNVVSVNEAAQKVLKQFVIH